MSKRLTGIQSLEVNGETLAVEGSNGVTYNLDPITKTPIFDFLGRPLGYSVEYKECFVSATIILAPDHIQPLPNIPGLSLSGGSDIIGEAVDGQELTLTTFAGQVIRLEGIFHTELGEVDTSTGTMEVRWVGWPSYSGGGNNAYSGSGISSVDLTGF